MQHYWGWSGRGRMLCSVATPCKEPQPSTTVFISSPSLFSFLHQASSLLSGSARRLFAGPSRSEEGWAREECSPWCSLQEQSILFAAAWTTSLLLGRLAKSLLASTPSRKEATQGAEEHAILLIIRSRKTCATPSPTVQAQVCLCYLHCPSWFPLVIAYL